MRLRLFTLFAASALAFPVASESQETPPNPYSGCFLVELSDLGAFAEELSEVGLTGSPVVEFILDPSQAWEMGFERTWRLHGPARAESVAFWWLEGDELVAVWSRSGLALELRLAPVADRLLGSARFAIRRDDAVFSVAASPADCGPLPYRPLHQRVISPPFSGSAKAGSSP